MKKISYANIYKLILLDADIRDILNKPRSNDLSIDEMDIDRLFHNNKGEIHKIKCAMFNFNPLLLKNSTSLLVHITTNSQFSLSQLSQMMNQLYDLFENKNINIHFGTTIYNGYKGCDLIFYYQE